MFSIRVTLNYGSCSKYNQEPCARWYQRFFDDVTHCPENCPYRPEASDEGTLEVRRRSRFLPCMTPDVGCAVSWLVPLMAAGRSALMAFQFAAYVLGNMIFGGQYTGTMRMPTLAVDNGILEGIRHPGARNFEISSLLQHRSTFNDLR